MHRNHTQERRIVVKIIKRVAITVFFVIGIVIGQPSHTNISFTEISRTNVGFGGNFSICSVLAHDSTDNWFVSGFNGSLPGADAARFSPNGYMVWKAVWGDSTAESVLHQIVYAQSDNSVITSADQQNGISWVLVPKVLVKFDGNDGHMIWQVKPGAEALQIWNGNILALHDVGSSTDSVSLVKIGDGSTESSFSIIAPSGGSFSGFPMMQVLGDTMWYFDDSFFLKILLPSGKLLWWVPTTDFAQAAIRTYGTVDSKGNAYVFTSDNTWNQHGASMYFAAARYSSDGKKTWANEWYGSADTTTASNVSLYNLNNWAEGIAIDESLKILAVYGGTQKAGTNVNEGNAQSAYLALLNTENGDTLVTNKWNDGSSDTLILTVWNDGYFDQKDQLILLGSSDFGNIVTYAGDYIANFIEVFSLNNVTGVKGQNYPNPFDPSTTISFCLPQRSFVTLKVFDVMGREISTIVSEALSPGNYFRKWNGTKMPSGVYFYRLQAGSYSETKKFLLIK
jgi:Secretion system C-terminal sorting domain